MAPETHQEGQGTAVPLVVASAPATPVEAARGIVETHGYGTVDTGLPGQARMPVCIACYDDWQGTPETGGCTAVLLARRVIDLEARLSQWEYEHGQVSDQWLRAVAGWNAAATRAARLAGLLRGLQWIETDEGALCCPECFAPQWAGHAAKCRLAAALAADDG